MLFTYLKNAYEEQITDKSFRAENKQRLNLSPHAYGVLLQDMDIFSAAMKKAGAAKLNSEIVNRIFVCFCYDARSSIARRQFEYEQQLKQLLQDITENHQGQELFPSNSRKQLRQNTIRLLADQQKQILLGERDQRCAEKGSPFYIRLNTDTMARLASSEETEEYFNGQAERIYYDNNVGLYLKAILEEYTQLPFAEREKVFFRHTVQIITKATEDRRMLKFTLPGSKQSGKQRRNNHLYMKPYKLCTDDEHLYNYAVGLVCQKKTGHWVPGAVRLSSISECTPLKESAFLSSTAKKDLDSRLQTHGVQYIAANEAAQRIVVQLTSQGVKMYRRMLHLRPVSTEILDSGIYVFHCTQWQALNYFFKFGKDAKILEPPTLAQSFRSRYLAAANQYEEL